MFCADFGGSTQLTRVGANPIFYTPRLLSTSFLFLFETLEISSLHRILVDKVLYSTFIRVSSSSMEEWLGERTKETDMVEGGASIV